MSGLDDQRRIADEAAAMARQVRSLADRVGRIDGLSEAMGLEAAADALDDLARVWDADSGECVYDATGVSS